MADPVKLRVILGENNVEKLVLYSGMPSSVDDLSQEIKRHFTIDGDIRLQYMDSDFGNDFVNLNLISDIQDKSTVKVLYLASMEMTCPNDSHITEDSVSLSSADTVLLSSPESTTTRSPWPREFPIPRFPFDAEMQLERGNQAFQTDGTLLVPSPKLKSEILESLAEQIMQFRAYPSNLDLEAVAEALIKKHPCLRERNSACGFYGWKISLKYKMANYRTKLRNLGCPELSINSLKHKPADKCQAAHDVKKPRKAEVHFFPSFPLGQTKDSLEQERLELITETKKKNNERVVKDKMAKTFAYRRQEVVQDKPMVAEFKARWPALFTLSELNTEFQRITTVPLQSRFLSQLDSYSDRFMKMFKKKGGSTGQTLKTILAGIREDDSIEHKRECVLKGLCIYLNEDPSKLVKEYLDTEGIEVQKNLQQTVIGIYVIRREGADATRPPEDVGIIVEGTDVIHNLGNVACACAMLFGVIYALNLSYPKDLKFTFEVIQKVVMELDAGRLSPKIHALKTKLCE